MARRTRIGIVLFDEVEVLDFAGPFEVFSVTRLDESRRREDKSPFDVVLVAEHLAPVMATGAMAVLPHRTFADCPPLDVLVVPGGWGTRDQVKNAAMLAWIREQAEHARIVAAVCTGSVLLGVAGLLEGKRATTHWRALDWMRETVPGATVDASKHFVIDGRVFTSAGISAGIDMSLRLVAHLLGEEVARATARQMEYPYPESDERRIAIPPA